MTSNYNIRLAYSKADIVDGLGLDSEPCPPSGAIKNTTTSDAAKSGLPSEFHFRCKDGERTAHLTRLAGKLIQQGHALDVVKALAQGWNQRNFEPLPEDKVNATCEGIWETHRRNHPEAVAGSSAAEGSLLFEPEEARVSRFIGKTPPERQWLVKNFLPYGKVAGLVAPGGTGKSQLLLQLAVSVAGGVPFLGLPDAPESGGVLVLAAEDDEEELHRRTYNIINFLAMAHRDDEELIRRITKNLYIRSMVAENNLMTVVANGAKEVTHTTYVDRLIRTAEKIQNLRLIIVDPASRFRGGEENAAQDTTRFIEALERLRTATGATVLIAHHTNKSSSLASGQNQNAARGSAAFTDGIRWQMNLQVVSEKRAGSLMLPKEHRRHYIEAEIVKNNYGPPIEPILLHREDGGFLVPVEIKTISANTDDGVLAEVVGILRKEMLKDKRYTRTSFEEKFGGENGPLHIGKTRLRSLLGYWVRSGKLHVTSKKELTPDTPMASDSKPASGIKSVKTKA
jgi:hypothetical protein